MKDIPYGRLKIVKINLKKQLLVLLMACLATKPLLAQQPFSNIGDVSVMPHTLMSIHMDFTNTEHAVFNNDGEVHLHSHLTNDGLVTFTTGSDGLTRFMGDSSQRISGTMPSDFYDIVFDNTAQQPAFQLYSDVSVYGEVNFIQGIVDGADFGGMFFFQKGSSHLSVSDESHVDGQLRKIGDEEFLFPIGDSHYYRHASLSTPNMESDHFIAQYFLQDTNSRFPHSQKESSITRINTNEYWSIERAQGNSMPIITLSWHQATTPADILSHVKDLHIVGWDAEKQQWLDYGGLVDVDNQTVSTILPILKYGVFTLALTHTPNDSFRLTVYDIVSPDDDGVNDFLKIENIENYPNNSLEIYNRWGVKVYGTTGYGQENNLFFGFSDGRATLERNEKLPEGTYYFILTYQDESGKKHRQAGGLFLSR